MKISDLPATPRQVFEGCAGKRPDLIIGPGHPAAITVGSAPAAKANAIRYFAVIHRPQAEPIFLFLGGNN